jgi:hypothetical protein
LVDDLGYPVVRHALLAAVQVGDYVLQRVAIGKLHCHVGPAIWQSAAAIDVDKAGRSQPAQQLAFAQQGLARLLDVAFAQGHVEVTEGFYRHQPIGHGALARQEDVRVAACANGANQLKFPVDKQANSCS